MQDLVTTSNYSIVTILYYRKFPLSKNKNFNKDEKTITTADLPFYKSGNHKNIVVMKM